MRTTLSTSVGDGYTSGEFTTMRERATLVRKNWKNYLVFEKEVDPLITSRDRWLTWRTSRQCLASRRLSASRPTAGGKGYRDFNSLSGGEGYSALHTGLTLHRSNWRNNSITFSGVSVDSSRSCIEGTQLLETTVGARAGCESITLLGHAIRLASILMVDRIMYAPS